MLNKNALKGTARIEMPINRMTRNFTFNAIRVALVTVRRLIQ